MDGLTGYQQRRLELADMIRAVLPVAHAYRDERREQEIRALLARLAGGRFQLAVIGQFSRGKTTLMNALLGDEYLPMGALPMTSVVTTVRYGTRARALVRSQATSLPVEVPVTDVARFVARASAERTRMQVATVEVEIPAELLRLGFEFVDTPGVGSAMAANTAATLRYLPRADAIVFVTGFDSALTTAETDFLATAAAQAGKLFLVINKRDLVSDADAAEVTAYVQRWARASLPAEPLVFGLSALQALEGAVNSNSRQVAGSGIDALREALTRFLTAEQGRAALGNAAAAAADVVARQQRDLSAGLRTDSERLDHASVAARFETRVSDLRDQIAAVADRIAATTSSAAVTVLAERRRAWEAELGEMLAPAAAAWSGAESVADGDPVPDALDALRLAGRQLAGEWLEQQAAELREVLIAGAADDFGILLDLARSPRELGAAMTGLAVRTSRETGWTPEELPQLTVPVVEWIVPDPPDSFRRYRGGRGAAGKASAVVAAAVSAAAADFARRAEDGFRVATADWARRLGEQAGRLASAEAAQFGRYLSVPPDDASLAVLTDLAGRLTAFSESLAAWIPDAPAPAIAEAEPQTAVPAAPGAVCAICSRLEATQTEYLIRRQFLLATSEAEQARHADSSGFCRLHTWQYAHLASPVGISAGNARLTSVLAGALREAGASSRDAGELAGHVAALALTASCPACAVVARAEQEAGEELAAQAATDVGPPRLCLRHLALVLRSCTSLPAGRAMTGALAAALSRASENMRAYALKREALRRGLITDDEASAYSDALRLLAGQPSLAMPAEPE